MIGNTFGRLTVLEEIKRHNGRQNHIYCRCVCDCGNEKIVRASSLKCGETKSCGCWRRDNAKQLFTTHGMKRTRFYTIWCSMKRRCESKTASNYERYGARGIRICERWQSFDNFFSDMYETYLKHTSEYSEKQTTIDRIDVNGNYEPDNCRWATYSEQALNKRK